jgi:hypothetical protein
VVTGRYPDLAWQQTSLGNWEREIDEAERSYTCLAEAYEGSGRMFFAITGFVSLAVDSKDTSSQQTGQRVERLAEASIRSPHDIVSNILRPSPAEVEGEIYPVLSERRRITKGTMAKVHFCNHLPWYVRA